MPHTRMPYWSFPRGVRDAVERQIAPVASAPSVGAGLNSSVAAPAHMRRGRYDCRFCRTPFMFSAASATGASRACGGTSIRCVVGDCGRPVHHADRAQLRHPGDEQPNLAAVEELLGEDRADVDASLGLARDLADLGARIHAHTFMRLPGTPWRDARPGDVDPETIREVDRLSQRGALYGHWQKQRDHAVRLAKAAEAYPRPGRSRTILSLADR